ncbi:MAG: hypothetical protein ACTJG2_02480 [Candidatus Saccharimonadales bacterium]
MKEFDFDELDRAVHSVLQDAQGEATPSQEVQSSPASSQDRSRTRTETHQRVPSRAIHARTMTSARPADRTVASLSSSVSQDTTAVNDNAATPQAPASVTTQTVRPLARRRLGRFMDVVHPSSDMKTSAMGTRHEKAVVPPSERPTVTLPPQQAQTPTPAPSYDDVFSANEGEASSIGHEIEKLLQEDPLADTPAPRDKKETTTPTPVITEETFAPTPVPEETSTPTPEVTQTPAPIFEPMTPQTSPFLEGAQVEKRPLGGRLQDQLEEFEETPTPIVDAPEDEADTEALREKIEAIESESHSQETPTPEVDVAAPVAADPEEIAAKDGATQPETIENAVQAADETTEHEVVVEEAGEKGEPAPTDVIEEDKPTVEAASADRGPSSIARQYKETPVVASEDDTSPIFDPETYHQPLVHETKKKSGWGVVIAILLLLLIGGGAVALLWWTDFLVVPL